jgi:hypothetical protein
MTDPRNHVRPGQPLSLAAEQVNWINAQMRSNPAFRTDATGAGWADRAPNHVLVRNTTGQVTPRLGVLSVNGVEIDPTGGTLSGSDAASNRAREFAFQPVLRGVAPNPAFYGDKFVICLEPIASNALGRAIISGMFACKVRINNTNHNYAMPLSNDRTQLQSTSCGPVLLIWKDVAGWTPPFQNDRWAVGVM